MNKLMGYLEQRRRALRNVHWLRPTLLIIDIALAAFAIPVSAIIGLVLIGLNEWLTPVAIFRKFYKDLQGEISPRGESTPRVIRGLADRQKGEE